MENTEESTEKQMSPEIITAANKVAMEIITKEGIEKKNATKIIGVASKIIAQKFEWEKLAAMEVVDKLDKKTIKQAYANRIAIKNSRIEGVEYLKTMGRVPAQKAMEHLQKEDTAYLRLIQYLEKSAKESEDKLSEIEKYPEIHAKALQDKLVAERTELIKDLCDDPSIYPLETLEEEAFKTMLLGLEAAKKAKEAAVIEQARLNKIAEEEAVALAKVQEEKTKVYNARRDIILSEAKPLGLDFELTLDTSLEAWEDFWKLLSEKKLEKVETDKKLLKEKQDLEDRENIRKKFIVLGFTETTEAFVIGEFSIPSVEAYAAITDPLSYAEIFEKASDFAMQHKAAEEKKLKEERSALRLKRMQELGFVLQDGFLVRENFDPISFAPVCEASDENFEKALSRALAKLVALQKAETDALKKGGKDILDSWLMEFKSPEFTPSDNPESEKVRQQILNGFNDFIESFKLVIQNM